MKDNNARDGSLSDFLQYIGVEHDELGEKGKSVADKIRQILDKNGSTLFRQTDTGKLGSIDLRPEAVLELRMDEVDEIATVLGVPSKEIFGRCSKLIDRNDKKKH